MEVGFFILPSKLRRTFQSQWQISKGLIDIPIFSLCQVDITGFSPNLCVQQSLNYHQQPDMTIYGLSSDVLTWRYIFFFLQFYSSSPFLFFNSPYSTTPSAPFPFIQVLCKRLLMPCTRRTHTKLLHFQLLWACFWAWKFPLQYRSSLNVKALA